MLQCDFSQVFYQKYKFYKWILKNILSIPDDLELVCVLDSKYNAMARPQISGFKIPDYDLGAVSMRVMTKMLQSDGKEETYHRETELSYVFTPRKTTIKMK